MNTNYEKELSDWLLSQKENLHVAFEIMNVFPLLRRKILRRFWEQVQDSIQKKLQKESTGWQMLRERGDPFQHDAWFGINVGRPNKQIEALELQFKIEQGLPKDFSLGPFFLYFGVVSTQELTGDKLKRIGSLPEYQNLQKSLMACECKEKGESWPGYKTRNMDSFDRFLGKFSEDQSSMIEDVVDEFWNLFLELHVNVDKANQAIAKNKIGTV